MKRSLSVFPIAPSSPFDHDQVDGGIAFLREHGFLVPLGAKRRECVPAYLNGSDAVRLEELHAALNSSCDLMWMARGGYGLTRIVPSLKLPNKNTPMLVGISDTTALHCHLWQHKRQKGVHASNLSRLSSEDPDALGILWAIFEGKARTINWPTLRPLVWASDQEVQGPLIVANLCVLTHLIGTPSMPALDGCILVLEEIGERPYRIDRMMTQLWHSGSLKGVKAIALGQFSGCEQLNDPGMTPYSILLERCQAFNLPLCEGLPVGHEIPNWPLPFGALARLRLVNGAINFEILEELF